MASGKTTLGRALTHAVPALRFIDLDEAVEEAGGTSVANIFATRGEEEFRALESAVLRSVASPDTVVACGGGTPCTAANMDFMLASGTVVRLEASVATIVRRLLEAPAEQRPLVAACHGDKAALTAKVEAMLSERAQAYARAPYSFNADRLDTEEQIAESVAEFSGRFLPAYFDKGV